MASGSVSPMPSYSQASQYNPSSIGPQASMGSNPSWNASTPPPMASGSVSPMPSYSQASQYNASAGPQASMGSNPSWNASSAAPMASGSQTPPSIAVTSPMASHTTPPTESYARPYSASAPAGASLGANPSWQPPNDTPLPSGTRDTIAYDAAAPYAGGSYSPPLPGPPRFSSPLDETTDPPITSNFILIIDGLTCGRWTDCSGLGLTYQTNPTYEADALSQTMLLEQRTAQKLTVSRPFGPASIEMLHWFELYGHVTIPLTATVMCCDSQGNPLYFWELMGVMPISWVGPKFKAGEAAYASETLTLSYSDFLSYGSWDLAGAIGGAIEAAATVAEAVVGLLNAPSLADDQGNSINFDIVPKSFKIGGGMSSVTQKMQPNATQPTNNFQGRKPRTLAFDLILDALTVRLSNITSVVSNLMGGGISDSLSFIYSLTGQPADPSSLAGSAASMLSGAVGGGGSSGSSSGSTMNPPPTTTFSWGSWTFSGWLTSYTATITRVDSMGNPMRATVSLTIGENMYAQGSQNPTSGSFGVNRTHTIVAGDSLASIAYDTYGRADRWRAIADLNGIDDPLRLRSGSTLLLPPDDVAAASR